MKKIFAILLSALALGGCENDGIPYVSLGLDDLYKARPHADRRSQTRLHGRKLPLDG